MKKHKKELTTKQLVKKALKDGFKLKHPKGYVSVAEIKPGKGFETECTKKRGIFVENNQCASTVVVVHCPMSYTEADDRYYLGLQRWANSTSVRRIENVYTNKNG